MTEIRTLDHLQEETSAEFAWRKKELHALKLMVIEAEKKTHNRDMSVRAAITLLYAHWEGFIRQIGEFYLEYVGRKQLSHDELRSNFLALAVRRLIHDAMEASSVAKCIEVVKFFRSTGPDRSNLNWRAGIDTKSNLKSSVFKDIVLMLGLDYSRFSTKEKLIDEKLLGNRNQIAHGQYLLVGHGDYLELHDEIRGMMEDFYNQVENSALTSAFRVQQPNPISN